MNAVTITARPWKRGWELWNGDDVWTQVKRLRNARQQVIDYLDSVEEGVDHSDWVIDIVPELDGWENVRAAREATREAARAQREAAEASRKVVRSLRSTGIATDDIATIMGISRGRVSQLSKP